jgi:hypothetical protein
MEKNFFHLCKWRFIGDVPFQYRERGLGDPPMLGSPLAPAGGTELLAHLHRWNFFRVFRVFRGLFFIGKDRRRAVWVGVLMCLLVLMPVTQAQSANRNQQRRLVLIKVDGLSPLYLYAGLQPDNAEVVNRLPDPDSWRRAVARLRTQTGRDILLPNFKTFFVDDGVWLSNMFSATSTLSAIAWGVVDTGQPSVIKSHMALSRDSGYLRSYLDAFRDTSDFFFRGAYKTTGMWVMEQAGVSVLADAFHPDRVWVTPQLYYRHPPWYYMKDLGLHIINRGHEFSNMKGIAKAHLAGRVQGGDYPDLNEDFVGLKAADKILERDYANTERYDFVNPYFTTVDHQFHVDPVPEAVLVALMGLDERVGTIMRAVQASARRDGTVVAIISDHGTDAQPGLTSVSWPITKVFRTQLFGGHTVSTVMAEDARHDLKTLVRGIDYVREYESEYSPYGKKRSPHGEDGYVTAFFDNFGNGRFDGYLRNNDLNRVHLLLLKLKTGNLSPDRFAQTRARFRQALDQLKSWLVEDMNVQEDYLHAAADLAAHLDQRADPNSKDSAAKLRAEIERESPPFRALRRLVNISFDDPESANSFDRLFSKSFSIQDYMPKGFLGRPNSFYQLSHYTVGVDDNLNWIETTINHKGDRVALNYFQRLTDFEADNPPANGEKRPCDFVIYAVPVRDIEPALRERGVVAPDQSLNQVAWVKSSARTNPRKGGEALLIEAADGQIKYVPISHLDQSEKGRFTFSLEAEVDPFGLLHDPNLHLPAETERRQWLTAFRPMHEWLTASYETEYGIAVINLLDVTGVHAERFLASEEFQRTLIHFSREELKQKYLAGVRRKYQLNVADLRAWPSPGWNFNSKGQTAGGSHGGIKPEVTRVTFAVWGGKNTGVARGQVISEVHTTLDLAPTLLKAIGMLSEDQRVIRAKGAFVERPFHPFPGRIIDLWRTRQEQYPNQ